MFKNQKNIEKNLRFFSWLGAILITLILPYMYLLGLAYYQGYMNEYGISSDMFPLTASDAYVNAFVLISIIIFKCLNIISGFLISNWILITVIVLVLGGIAIYFVIRKVKAGSANVCDSKNIPVKPIASDSTTISINLVDRFFQTIWIVGAFVFILCLLWIGVDMAQAVGKSVALDAVSKYKKDACESDPKAKWNACVKLVNGAGLTMQEGLFVAKNSDEIALFKKEGSFVYRLNDGVIIVKLRNN